MVRERDWKREKEKRPQPPFGPSVASLCHPWFTTTNLSYRFPIFETSATALCGTTGTARRDRRASFVLFHMDPGALWHHWSVMAWPISKPSGTGDLMWDPGWRCGGGGQVFVKSVVPFAAGHWGPFGGCFAVKFPWTFWRLFRSRSLAVLSWLASYAYTGVLWYHVFVKVCQVLYPYLEKMTRWKQTLLPWCANTGLGLMMLGIFVWPYEVLDQAGHGDFWPLLAAILLLPGVYIFSLRSCRCSQCFTNIFQFKGFKRIAIKWLMETKSCGVDSVDAS